MSVTIISQPNLINSVFNPNQWVVDSTNKSKSGFRYIFNIGIIGEDLSLIERKFRVAPRPNDGFGELDVSFVLKNMMETRVDFESAETNLFFDNFKFARAYILQVFEEYFEDWKYNDTEFVSGHRTKAVGTANHTFQIGDVVEVTPTNKNLFPEFNGVLNVIDIPDPQSVVFDVIFRSTPTNGGRMKFADNRKIVAGPMFQSEGNFAYKSALDFNTWTRNKFEEVYGLGDIPKQLLTTFKSGFKVTKNCELFIPTVYEPEYNSLYDVVLKYQRSDSLILSKALPSANFGETRFVNAIPKSGLTQDLFENGIKYYDFWVEVAGIRVSEKIRIFIDNDCGVNDTVLIFEDSLGSFQSLAFKGFKKKTVTIDKETYLKPLNVAQNSYNPETERLIVGFNKTKDEIIELSGFPYSREQDLIFEELILSNNVWFKNLGTVYPCEVETVSFSFKDVKQGGLRKRNVNIRLSNKTALNG